MISLTNMPSHRKTLVLDIDNTLVHSLPFWMFGDASKYGKGPDYIARGIRGYIRPGAQEFIVKVGKLFDVAVFTSAQKDYADDIIKVIDPTGVIKTRLYRESVDTCGGKDLSKFGVDLKDIVIVDDIQHSFLRHFCNGILISAWALDWNDTALSKIYNVLEEVAVAVDARETINKCTFGPVLDSQSRDSRASTLVAMRSLYF